MISILYGTNTPLSQREVNRISIKDTRDESFRTFYVSHVVQTNSLTRSPTREPKEGSSYFPSSSKCSNPFCLSCDPVLLEVVRDNYDDNFIQKQTKTFGSARLSVPSTKFSTTYTYFTWCTTKLQRKPRP